MPEIRLKHPEKYPKILKFYFFTCFIEAYVRYYASVIEKQMSRHLQRSTTTDARMNEELFEEKYPNQSSFVNLDNVPKKDELIVSQVVPGVFDGTYHHHPSIEFNFITGCQMEYSFSGTRFFVPEEKIIVFWGSTPHSVTMVKGTGTSILIYLSINQLLKLNLPNSFVEDIFSGSVIATNTSKAFDKANFNQWLTDYRSNETQRRLLVLGEIQMRLKRMAIEGYDILLQGNMDSDIRLNSSSSRRRLDKMLKYIASNFTSKITVTSVAREVNISNSYAMSMFRKFVGMPINEYIIQIRLSHARMLLASTNNEILSIAMECGFGSISSFYSSFQSHYHETPRKFRKRIREVD